MDSTPRLLPSQGEAADAFFVPPFKSPAADDDGGAGGVALTAVDDDVADGASFSESSVCVGLAQLAFPMVFFAASCVVVSVPAYSFFIDGKFIGLGTAMRAKSAGLGCAFARPSGFMF